MIRKAVDADTCFIYETLKDTLTPWAEQGISDSIKNDMALICEGAGVIIARVTPGECEILNFAVGREKRGQGFGEALLQRLLEEAKKTGADTVYLDVRKTNNAAISLYKKAGFEIYSERKDFYRNPPEDAVLMRLNL